MRTLVVAIVIMYFNPLFSKGQKDTFILRTDFANQGEQEDYWAEKLFFEKYQKQDYQKFQGEIIVCDNNHIKFGNKILKSYFPSEYRSIFTHGLFYPQLITGDSVALKKSQEEINEMTASQRVFYFMTQNDTLSIGHFEELKFLSKNPTIKRFRFWEYRKWIANPQVHFIELTNTRATNSTDLKTFINGATLTFVKAGWVIF